MANATSPSSEAPIGILDSGLGGLTVLLEAQRRLPAEALLYIADTANVPYGDKSIEVVRDLALKLTHHLVCSGAKLVIMASGTSTVAGLAAAQAEFPQIPIVGTISGGARAAAAHVTGKIGVMSTNATARSLAFTHAIHELDPSRSVFEQGCPRFVPLVESGRAESAEAVDASIQYLTPLARAGIEAIILGCTHFPFLSAALENAATQIPNFPSFRPCFIDPAAEAVRDVIRLLEVNGLNNTISEAVSRVNFECTGDPHEFGRYASGLLGHTVRDVKSLILN